MKRFIALVLLLGTAAQPAFADTLTINPDNLASILDAGNIDVAREAENVHKAKLGIQVAIGNLIPSLSVMLSSTIANPPQFLVNSVTCLVPFLFPGKWYDLAAAKNTASAEAAALEITRLNTYAVAYALLNQYSDLQQLLALLNDQYKRLDDYVKGLQAQYDLGLISQADLLRGELELSRSQSDLSRATESMSNDYGALRKMLGVDNIETVLNIDFDSEDPSTLESAPLTQAVVLDLYRRAPERRQLDLLIDAAQDAVSSSEWSWLAGCSGSQGALGPTSTQSTFTQTTSIGINIGYPFFPQIAIAKSSVRDIELREKDLSLELARIFETTQSSVAIVKQRMADAQSAVDIAEALLFEQTHLVELGKASVKDVLDAYSAVTRAKGEYLLAKSTLDGHRITLKRLALEGRFLKVLIKSRREIEIKKTIK